MRRSFSTLIELSVLPFLIMAVYVWGESINWQMDDISKLNVFPLLGLLAFTIMWWHFLLGFIKDLNPNFNKLRKLHSTSSIFVFIVIIFHPLLLASYGISNDLGRPPGSYISYVGEANKFYILLGIISFTIFILYDLARVLSKKPFVKRNWLVIDAIDDVAFIAIFFHSLMIGSHIQSGWFRYVWIFYGVSGLVFITTKHLIRFLKRSN